jgi:penicillin-binding protein 1A
MALGANGVYLNEMVPAYATFAAGGVRPTPVYIKKITDVEDNVLEEFTPPEAGKPEAEDISEDQAKKMKDLNTELFDAAQKYIETDHLVLSQEEMKILYGDVIPKGYTITPQTAYMMTRLLEEVVDRGTGTRVKALGKPVAGKTGTTNDETDCWFIGFVPDLASGVWVGFDNIAKIGNKETGGKTAAPIFLEYMKEATKDMGAKDFEPPKGLKPDRVATMTGGSAIYFRGYSRLREGLGLGQRTEDRAIDFFEEDLSGGSAQTPEAKAPPKQATPAEKAEEDDFAY